MRERRERRGERGWRGARRGRAAHAPPPPCSNAYNMVINKFGGRLYDGLAASVTAHLTAVAASLATARGEELLRALKTAWDAHCKSMQMIRDILMVGDGEERGEKEKRDARAGPTLTLTPPSTPLLLSSPYSTWTASTSSTPAAPPCTSSASTRGATP